MASWLTTILGWFGYKQGTSTTTTTNTNQSLDIGITSDIGAVAGAVGEGAKLATTILTEENSPQMIQGRENAALQKAKDKNAKDADEALRTGNLTEVEKDLS